jgi:chloride channel 3/4/5
VLERNRRIRDARRFDAAHRGPRGEVTVSWLWTQLRKALDGGQTWFVVSLVGASSQV